MAKTELERRTKAFSLEIIKFVSRLPKSYIADVMGRQLLRAATSVGANYREANRAESRQDFIHRIAITEKEASEACYWLELFSEAGIGDSSRLAPLLKEAQELLAIFTTIGKRTKKPLIREEEAAFSPDVFASDADLD